MATIIKIQLRRDTSANWATANPVLNQGEPGMETDTRMIKFGDGVTAWNSLPYFYEDRTFLFTQGVPASTWVVAHNLNKRPTVAVVDSSGNEVEGEINYSDNNNLTITFSAPFTGDAYIN